MSIYFLAAFLIIYALNELVSTAIPRWVIGLLALMAAAAMLIDKRKPG